MEFVLTAPMIITPRLTPGAMIGDATVSIQPKEVESDGRTWWAVYIDGPNVEFADERCISLGPQHQLNGGSAREAMRTLTSFLGSEAENYREHMRDSARPEDGWLFDGAEFAEWAYNMEDEINSLHFELENDDEE